jgi:hypothetical protein
LRTLEAAARAYLATQKAERNQCDGCARGLLPDNRGLHRDPKTDLPIMACTAHLYLAKDPT